VLRRAREGRVQCFKVGMDVAKEQYAHGSPDKLPIID
jgi:hypothetical protein